MTGIGRRPSPITLSEPSPVKASPPRPAPPASHAGGEEMMRKVEKGSKGPAAAVVMSPAMLEQLLKSGATLGPQRPVLPPSTQLPSTAPRAVNPTAGTRAHTADGRPLPRAPPLLPDLPKDVFFDPEKRAEALRALKQARGSPASLTVTVVKPGAFDTLDPVIQRGRQAMMATRHHMYKQ